MARVVIIGYGNPLRGDDAIGWHVAKIISEEFPGPEVRVIACHQLTPELAQDISQAGSVVFVDAARDLPAGEMCCEPVAPKAENEKAAAMSYSHHLSPSGLLSLCHELYSSTPRAFLVRVGGERFEQADGLSGTAAKGLEEAVARLRTFISTGEFNIL